MRTEGYWAGREVEGRLLGVETLFIGSEFPPTDVIDAYPHLYVGVAFLRALIEQTSEAVKKQHWDAIREVIKSRRTVTLEVEPHMKIPIDLIPLCHLLVRVPFSSWALGLKPSDTIAFDMGPYHCLTVTKHQMLEVKSDQYQFDRGIDV